MKCYALYFYFIYSGNKETVSTNKVVDVRSIVQYCLVYDETATTSLRHNRDYCVKLFPIIETSKNEIRPVVSLRNKIFLAILLEMSKGSAGGVLSGIYEK